MPSRFDRETRAKALRLVKDHVEEYESEWERTIEVLKAATGFFAWGSATRCPDDL